MFDSIAPRYDLLNHLLSFGVDRLWRRRMVGVVAAGTPAAILDVAAGTGDVAVALARRLPAARITGIDLSGEMLAVGRGKVARRGLCDRIELVQGDAEQLSFPDGTFDAVTIGFAISAASRPVSPKPSGCFAPAAGSVSSNFRRPADVVSARCTGSISTVSCRWWGA